MNRKALLWGALAATTLLSVASLQWTPADVDLVRTSRPTSSRAIPSSPHVPAQVDGPTSESSDAIASFSRPPITAAKADPFVLEPARPVAPMNVAAPVVPVVATPPPPPLVQPYRLFGRLQSPEGQRIVYLVNGEKIVAIQPGIALDAGYQVETISDDDIVLRHQPSGQEAHIAIPRQPSS